MNLSRLSNYCGYSVFSNESTESLDTSALDSSLTGSPSSVRLAVRKSRSGSLAATGNGESGESERLLTRDPSSVPNFSDLQLQTVSPDEADSQVQIHLILGRVIRPKPNDRINKNQMTEYFDQTTEYYQMAKFLLH